MIEARKYSTAQLIKACDRRSRLYDKVVAPLERGCHGAADDRPNLHEFLYEHLPAKLVLYLAGGCRPVMMAAEVEAAGFSMVERACLTGRYPSEIVTAIKEVG